MKLRNILKRIQKPEDPKGCWKWCGSIDRDGYGVLSHGGKKSTGAHRVLYELEYGTIPEGMTIHHRCHVRDCVNPRHLESQTPAMNSSLNKQMRPLKPTKTQIERALRDKAGVCLRGHVLSEVGTVVKNYSATNKTIKTCQACRQDSQAEHRRRNGVAQTRRRTGSYGPRDPNRPKSGVKGISWASQAKKWNVAVYKDGVNHYNGQWSTLDEAQQALDVLCERLGMDSY